MQAAGDIAANAGKAEPPQSLADNGTPAACVCWSFLEVDGLLTCIGNAIRLWDLGRAVGSGIQRRPAFFILFSRPRKPPAVPPRPATAAAPGTFHPGCITHHTASAATTTASGIHTSCGDQSGSERLAHCNQRFGFMGISFLENLTRPICAIRVE